MFTQAIRPLPSFTRSLLVFALAVVGPVGLGVGCASDPDDADSSLDAVETEASTSALRGSVAVGTALQVVRDGSLRASPGESRRIRRLSEGEMVLAVEASPTNGYYHVKTVSDGLDGYAHRNILRVASNQPVPQPLPDNDGGTGGTGGSGTVPPPPPPPPTGTIWRPVPRTTWQWQLTGTIDTSVNAAMYDIDLVDAPQSTIDALHAAGRIVICYFSAGSYEQWRSDAMAFPTAALGNTLDGWPDERWLDTRDAGVRNVMRTRLDLAKSKRCDGVEPDNVDGYTNDPGFPLTSATQIDYNKFLAAEAHARGLSIGLKNDLDQVKALEPFFDWALNEQCAQYKECNMLSPFVAANKAVFQTEYSKSCPSLTPGHSIILKSLNLNAPRTVCQ